MKKRVLSVFLAIFMLAGLMPTVAMAAVVKDDDGNISYEPFEQGNFSEGGYTIEKISHPTRGAGEIDGILTGENEERGNSYSWSMADGGENSDYIYIGTCFNSTYFIFHNNVKTSLQKMQKDGILSPEFDAGKIAADFVKVMFGADTFDETEITDWEPVIIAVNKITGEPTIVFDERSIWSENPTIFPGYSPNMPVKNYPAGYRMAFEFHGKIYFAGMGNPTATLVEVDPLTNEAKIVYYNINYKQGVQNGVHGLLVYDDEILMCLATDDYDGNGTPGARIVASSDPSAGLENWRVIADSDDFDGLPAVMKIDGLNGGGIWDIIEYNGDVYATIVTDKSIDGKINKQGFALYHGRKDLAGNFTWTQVVGDHGTSGYGFGMGINYSMSANMWVYDDHLYIGTYNDPMLDLAEIPATGNFELLYNDLDHSIYLYRMDKDGTFEQIGGKNDNLNFPDGPKGNLGAGLGNNSNQYVWRMCVHNNEFYIGTYDTSTLTYQFTQLTDGKVANMDYEDIHERADYLHEMLNAILNEYDSPAMQWFLEKTIFSDFTIKLFQQLSGFATGMSADENPVPDYRQMLDDYEKFKTKVYDVLNSLMRLSSPEFLQDYSTEVEVSEYAIEADMNGYVSGLKDGLKKMVDDIFAVYDNVIYDENIHNFVYYFGCNYYAQQSESGFDVLVSNDGINFDAITRNGLGDSANHGIRTICSTKYGTFLGTANPYYGTQLWLMHNDKDAPREEKTVKYTVSASAVPANGGNVTGGGVYDKGTEASVTASPFEGFDFVNWTENGEEVSADTVYTFKVESDRNLAANFKEKGAVAPSAYTVTWKNEDGTVLETDKNVAKDTMPTYDGETPVKPDDEQYSYVFAGWNPKVVKVTEDATYVAEFTQSNKDNGDKDNDGKNKDDKDNGGKNNGGKDNGNKDSGKTPDSKSNISTPKTGDNSNTLIWFVAAVFSVLSMVTVGFEKKHLSHKVR